MTATACAHIVAKKQSAPVALESIKQPAADNSVNKKFSSVKQNDN